MFSSQGFSTQADKKNLTYVAPLLQQTHSHNTTTALEKAFKCVDEVSQRGEESHIFITAESKKKKENKKKEDVHTHQGQFVSFSS